MSLHFSHDKQAPQDEQDEPVAEPSHSSGDYVVVARRYRPQGFDELIGQQHVSQALKRAIESDRVGHAYLFTGARGVGKTSAARILAKALNCVEGPTATPCNQCEICQSISSGDDIDVLEIDGASNRGIDEIRQLRQNVAVRPSRARLKIYIIDEVHMLTKEAFNALLKTLEEPPEHVKFIFATTEPNKIPITILSRCQRFDFAGIEATAIQKRLSQIAEAEGVQVDADALQILAMRAAGSMRDSQSLLEQLLAGSGESITADDVTQMLGIAPAARLSQLVMPLVNRDAATALSELDAAISEGAEVGQLLDQLLGYFRDVMTQAVGCDEYRLMFALPSQHQEVRELASKLGVHKLLAIVQVLDQALARMRISVHTRTLAEMAVVRICHLEDLDELASLIEQFKQLAPGDLPESNREKKNDSVQLNPARLTRPEAPRSVSQRSPIPQQAADSVSVDDDQEATPTASAASGSMSAAVSPNPAVSLNPDNAEQIWKQVIGNLSGMMADQAAQADEVSVDSTGRLNVFFAESFSRDWCEKPANRAKLDEALRKVCGSSIPLALQVRPGSSPQTKRPTSSVQLKRQQQLEVTARPFVSKALELFDGDAHAVRYVPPRESS